MESLQDSNCYSLSDNFSLYERYMRSFKVGDNLSENNSNCDLRGPPVNNSKTQNSYHSSESRSNIDLTIVESNVINKYKETAESNYLINTSDNLDRASSLDTDLCAKINSPFISLETSLDNSSATIDKSLLHDKSNHTDIHISSEEIRIGKKQPVFITPTMENSNNAVDSVPLFSNVTPTESVFKLPISELSFIGTIKHVKKLKPIVDPMTALTSSNGLKNLDKSQTFVNDSESEDYNVNRDSNEDMHMVEKTPGSIEHSHFTVLSEKKMSCEEGANKWNSDHSYTSLDASYDSGLKSPNIFSEDDDDYDDERTAESEPFWTFLKDYEAHEKRKVRKTEEILQGVLPPPSVTILKTNVTEMLKKYYDFLPLFNKTAQEVSEVNFVTPTKRVSFVEIPEHVIQYNALDEACSSLIADQSTCKNEDVNLYNKSTELKLYTNAEAMETAWPHILKCRYHDVYYNVTKHSERYELLALRYGQRYVGAETDTSVNIYSGGLQSPSSASKRKSLRLKLAQAKSPGRRLSHLARRRQAFCSAATINEKARTSTAKMVLIDKNFFPHRKFISTGERKSPRLKKTPPRRTPGKTTPAKTPKTRSGGSSKKKAMRRLLMDSETLSRTQPTRETLKRALFISPESRKSTPQTSNGSILSQGLEPRQGFFSSTVRTADTKSCDGSQSDQFLKRKLDALDNEPETSKSKIVKSLSFGGDNMSSTQPIPFTRRASEFSTATVTAQLNEIHKKKLLWAVSEALRGHGWRMSSPGFKEKASSLARLTRRLLTLPHNAAKLKAPQLSTSETMFKLARQYVFAIIQGRSVDDCYQEEQLKIANETTSKIKGYISDSAYQQLKSNQVTFTCTSQIKENSRKNVLQDKLNNIDANSNSNSGLSVFDKPSLGLFKSNSMPSFEETEKLRVKRQISFDNAIFPKR